MVNYTTVFVFALMVGIASAYPQQRRTQNHRRQTSDADALLTADAPDDAVDNSVAVEAATTPAATPRLLDAPQDPVEGDTNAEEDNALGLPSNATSIRAKIVDTFSCEGRVYGYYADVDNDCQIFHVCLPVQQPGSKGRTFKWSFICPEQTIFNQEKFTCTRPEDALPCGDAPNYFRLNDNFGVTGKPEERRADADLESRSAVEDSDVDAIADADVDEATTPLAEQA